MEVFYEESAAYHKAEKSKTKYTILSVLSGLFLFLTCFMLFLTLLTIPNVGYMLFFGMPALMFLGFWFAFWKWKSTVNVSYDYAFVSGELRIARVYNTKKRKAVARFDCADIIQFGDVDSPSYERLRTDPTTKNVICTSNYEAAEGKFFMYVLAQYNGKKLFVLECTENLLMNILKFVKRSALDRDYVMQEKKRQTLQAQQAQQTQRV